MSGPVAVVRPRRIAWVEGPDAMALLHGLLTADIEAVPVGGAVRSLVLTTHGHVVARMAVARDGEQGACELFLATQRLEAGGPHPP